MLLLLLFSQLAYSSIFSLPQRDNVTEFAQLHGLVHLKRLVGFDIFSGSLNRRTRFIDGLFIDEKKKQFKRYFRSGVTDPLYNSQWHLHGPYGVWDDASDATSVSGKGIVVAIVDDGLQFRHPDLLDNYVAGLSHNFNSGNANDPTPSQDDGHGTSASGVCCATRNTHCGRGVAYSASLVGIRLISEGTYDYQEAEGLSYKSDKIRIYSNSWGPEVSPYFF